MCKLAVDHDPRPLELNKHRWLHPEGNQLITSWFTKAWAQRDDDDAIFESFIFAWFSVNAWAACVTGIDRDCDYIRRLQRDRALREKFTSLLTTDAVFRDAARSFYGMWPIFKAQKIRQQQHHAKQGLTRAEVIQHYFSAGIDEFEPSCWLEHKDAGESVPLDWPHTLAAIYRVRNNLFHGEKSAHSEMDRSVVRAALETLVLFFRGADIL